MKLVSLRHLGPLRFTLSDVYLADSIHLLICLAQVFSTSQDHQRLYLMEELYCIPVPAASMAEVNTQ